MSKQIIPEPVKERIQRKDQRKRYLNKWKSLFESIHPEIQVIIDRMNINSKVRETTDDIYLEYDFKNFEILVILPKELELEYLIGLSYDQMFSKREIDNDTFVRDNPGYPYSPEVKKWKDFYYELCNIFNRNIKQIPKPVKIV